MNNQEINEFIEQMETIGDSWTVDQVKDVYGNTSLEDALKDRKSSVDQLLSIMGKGINRD